MIDILVGVETLDRSRPCIEKVASLGYLYSPYLGDVMHWFCKPDVTRRTHHLHLVPAGSPRYLDELAFRDALRGDPALAERYATLKRDLAARFPDDRNIYTQHKAPFVREYLTSSDPARRPEPPSPAVSTGGSWPRGRDPPGRVACCRFPPPLGTSAMAGFTTRRHPR